VSQDTETTVGATSQVVRRTVIRGRVLGGYFTASGQTGHKSLPVLRRYIRRGTLFNGNAASRIGL